MYSKTNTDLNCIELHFHPEAYIKTAEQQFVRLYKNHL